MDDIRDSQTVISSRKSEEPREPRETKFSQTKAASGLNRPDILAGHAHLDATWSRSIGVS